MDQFPGLLAKDFGFEPVPMGSSDNRSPGVFHDVFGGPPKYINSSDGRTTTTPLTSSFNIGSMFQDLKTSKNPRSSTPSPLYNDENIFEGLPGLKSSSSSVNSSNGFSSARNESSSFDDFLGNLGSKKLSSSGSRKKWGEVDQNGSRSGSGSGSAFEELIPGFGGSSPPKNRETLRSSVPQQSGVPSTISTSSVREDPLVVLQSAPLPAYASQRLFSEPLEQHKPNQSSVEVGVSSDQGKIFDDLDPINSTAKLKSFPLSGGSNIEKDGSNSYRLHNSVGKEPTGEPPEISKDSLQKNMPNNNVRESQQSLFDAPTFSDSHHTFTQNGSHPYASSNERSSYRAMSPQSEASAIADDVWLTVSEVALVTLPTSAPPPSRPPPRPHQILNEVKGSVKSKASNFSSFYHSVQSYLSPQTVLDAAKSPDISSINELERFAMGGTRSTADEHVHVISDEDNSDNSAAAVSAAAVSAAVDRAEVKFKHAKQVRERENAAKVNGAQRERDEKVKQDMQEQVLGEKQEGLDCEQDERGRSEKDREQRRIEKEREQALEIEREREKGRQAVDRAMKEVRERAAAGARQKAERIAVDKVNAGARERAERAAVQRAQAEARERAAIEARERAEKAASEAIERKNAEEKEKAAAVARAEAEARIRADRAAVNRANAEARERAAAAAAASATRGQQHKDGNDLDSFFNANAQQDNTSKPRTGSPDSMSEAHLNNRPGPEQAQHSSAGTSSSTRKASSRTSIVDDLDSIFGATSRSEDIQENVGETNGRRRSRLERDQRTQERVKKAVDEKNERDRHTQWEQAEKQRMAESLDFEIKRWSAGKEGNLRALLSTLHYVLWPECGWQPVSLTDLITSASVKKVYRKATLCIHPDKVQQKGANLQQKFIAEKVFDLLKEAWNKLNSEELF